MPEINWLLWAVVLFAQNFSFTLVSRARNSGSIAYHAIAAVGSNGVWIAGQFILVDQVIRVLRAGSWSQGVIVALFYTACTVVGSITSHYVSMRWLEKGKRKIGG